MKKVGLMFVAVLMTMVMLAGSAFATPGYQTIGSWQVNYGSNVPAYFTTGNVTAHDGGYARVMLSDHYIIGTKPQYPFILVELWEDDGATGDDFIGQAYYYPNTMGAKAFYFNTAGFGDGVGLKPELYVRTTSTYDSSTFTLSIAN